MEHIPVAPGSYSCGNLEPTKVHLRTMMGKEQVQDDLDALAFARRYKIRLVRKGVGWQMVCEPNA